MVETKMSKESKWKIKTINIDIRKRIVSISVNMYHSWIRGLRLVDANGKYLVNYTWCTDAI